MNVENASVSRRVCTAYSPKALPEETVCAQSWGAGRVGESSSASGKVLGSTACPGSHH